MISMKRAFCDFIGVKTVVSDADGALTCARSSKRVTAAGVLTAALSVALFAPGSALAAFVTTQEAGMDAIYSQASFGANTIDIRFMPTVDLFAPDLLDITTGAEITALFAMGGAAPVVNWFYIDTISYCGGFNVNIVGCGQLPGNNFVVESSFAAGANGAELLGHELGHNLGLSHVGQNPGDNSNLMNPFLNGGINLLAFQVNTILASGLVQQDGAGKYITVQPILVTAVPLPGALPLMLSALALLGAAGVKRRKTS